MRTVPLPVLVFAIILTAGVTSALLRDEPNDEPSAPSGSASTPDWIVVTVNSVSRDDWVLRGPHIVDTGSIQMVMPNSTAIDAVDPKANLVIEMMGSPIRLDLEETVSQVCGAIGDCSILARVMPTSDEISEQIQRQMRAEDAIGAVRERRADEDEDPPSMLEAFREAAQESSTPTALEALEQFREQEWLDQCDANGNGRVTCAEARAGTCGAPIPVTNEHPLYQFMMDGDGNGRVCE